MHCMFRRILAVWLALAALMPGHAQSGPALSKQAVAVKRKADLLSPTGSYQRRASGCG
jgi:hypothetical protein